MYKVQSQQSTNEQAALPGWAPAQNDFIQGYCSRMESVG